MLVKYGAFEQKQVFLINYIPCAFIANQYQTKIVAAFVFFCNRNISWCEIRMQWKRWKIFSVFRRFGVAYISKGVFCTARRSEIAIVRVRLFVNALLHFYVSIAWVSASLQLLYPPPCLWMCYFFRFTTSIRLICRVCRHLSARILTATSSGKISFVGIFCFVACYVLSNALAMPNH